MNISSYQHACRIDAPPLRLLPASTCTLNRVFCALARVINTFRLVHLFDTYAFVCFPCFFLCIAFHEASIRFFRWSDSMSSVLRYSGDWQICSQPERMNATRSSVIGPLNMFERVRWQNFSIHFDAIPFRGKKTVLPCTYHHEQFPTRRNENERTKAHPS